MPTSVASIVSAEMTPAPERALRPD